MPVCDYCGKLIHRVCFFEKINGVLYTYHSDCYSKLTKLIRYKYGNPQNPEPNA